MFPKNFLKVEIVEDLETLRNKFNKQDWLIVSGEIMYEFEKY